MIHMRKIPEELLKEMLSEKFYRSCCICGSKHRQLHHNLIFGRAQQNIKSAILPLCGACHARADNVEFRERLDHIMLNRMTEEEIDTYSRVRNLRERRKFLNEKFRRETN